MSLVTRLSDSSVDYGINTYYGNPLLTIINVSNSVGSTPRPTISGDMIVAVAIIREYRIQPGDAGFNPARLVLGPRWAYCDHWVSRQGGTPGIIAELYLVLVFRPDGTDLAASSWEAARLTGQTREDGFTFRITNGPGNLYATRAWLFRGDTGIADVSWEQIDTPTYAHQTISGWSFSGVGSTIRILDSLDRSAGGYPLLLGSPFMSTVDAPAGRGTALPWTGDVASPTAPVLPLYARRFEYSTEWSRATQLPSLAASITVGATAAPLRPTITSPVDGTQLDMQGQPHTLTWTYAPGTAGAQTGVQIIRQVAGVDLWLNLDTGAWGTTPYTNPWSAQSATIPAGGWAHGTLGSLTVATVGQSGTPSRRSLPVWVASVPAPTAGVTVVGFSGGRVADMTPTVVVTGTPGHPNAAITAWQAELVSAATGTLLAAGSGVALGEWNPQYQATNSESLLMRARVKQSGGEWSPWVSRTVVVDVTTPGPPTVTATPWRHPVSNTPGQQLTVAFPDDAYPWPTATTRLAIWRTGDDGVPVLITDAVMPAGQRTATRYDYAAPTGQTVRYSARGTGVTPDGGTLIGQAGVSADTDQAAEGCWVVDPAAPEAAVLAHIASDSDRSVGQRTVLRPLGSPAAVVVDGGPTLESGTVTFQSGSAEHRARLMGLLNAGRVLLLRWPVEVDWDGGDPHAPDTWLRVSGPVVMERPVRGPYQYRTVQVPWVGTPPVVAG